MMTHGRAEPMVGQVADRIGMWSRQEQALVELLAHLRTGSTGSTRHVEDAPAQLLARWNLESPTAAPQSLAEDLGGSALVDQWIPVVQDPADPPLGPEDERCSTETDAVPAEPHRPPGPFDDLVAVVGQTQRESIRRNGPLPSRSRFMVRVARVPKASRATKRNYDYFEDLNVALAERAARSESQAGGANGQAVPDGWLQTRNSG